MSEENNLDFQTFQVYPDEEQAVSKSDTDKKGKKGLLGKSIKNKVTNSNTSPRKEKKSLDINEILKKISPVTACIIGVGIVFAYIAFDIVSSI